MNNLIVRTVTGFFFIASIIGSILLGHGWFSALFFVITLATLVEFFRLIKQRSGVEVQLITGTIAGVLIYLLASLAAMQIIALKYLVISLLLPLILFLNELFRKKETPFLNVSVTIVGIIYIAIPFSALNFILNPGLVVEEYHPANLIVFFVILWTYDTFAYLTGMMLGRHRLLERVSPKKSWEGAAGGFLFGLLAAWIVALIMHRIDFAILAGEALIIMFFGTFGDLVESLLKRSLNVKDSGNILPGHGGMLDRFDAVLFAAPAVLIYYLLI